MKRPRNSDDTVKQSPVRLHIHEKAERAVNGDDQNAVEGKKIWCQSDPEVGLAGHNMSAIATHSESADTSAHQPNPQRVRQLVPENVY